jgi:hypothetical protein
MRFHSIFSLIDFVRIQPWGHVAGNRTPQAATSVYFCLSPLGILRHGISSSMAEEYRPHTQDGSLRLNSAAGLGTKYLLRHGANRLEDVLQESLDVTQGGSIS